MGYNHLGIMFISLIVLIVLMGLFKNSRKPIETFAEPDDKSVWDKIYCTFQKCDGDAAASGDAPTRREEDVLGVFKEMKTDIQSIKGALPQYLTKNELDKEVKTQFLGSADIMTNSLTVREDAKFKDDIYIDSGNSVYIEGDHNGPLIENKQVFKTTDGTQEFLDRHGVGIIKEETDDKISKKTMRMYTAGDMGEGNLAWSFIDAENKYQDVLVAKKNGNKISLNLKTGDLVVENGKICMGNECVDKNRWEQIKNMVLAQYEDWTPATRNVSESSPNHWKKSVESGFIHSFLANDSDVNEGIATSAWVEYNVPTDMKQAYLVYLPSITSRYFDVYGRVEGVGEYIFVKRVNSWSPEDIDKKRGVNKFKYGIASTSIAAVNRFESLRIQGAQGRVFLMGLGWTREEGRDMESGFMSWSNIYNKPVNIMITGSNMTGDITTTDGRIFGASIASTGKISTTNGIVVGPATWTVNPGDITIQNSYYGTGAQLRGGLRVGEGSIPRNGTIETDFMNTKEFASSGSGKISGGLGVGSSAIPKIGEIVASGKITGGSLFTGGEVNAGSGTFTGALHAGGKISTVNGISVGKGIENVSVGDVSIQNNYYGSSARLTGGLRIGNGAIPNNGDIEASGKITGNSISANSGNITGAFNTGGKLSTTNGLSVGTGIESVSPGDVSIQHNYYGSGGRLTGGLRVGGKEAIPNNGEIVASGKITGGSLFTGGSLNADNATITNGLQASNITATGNVTGRNINTTGGVSLGGDMVFTGNNEWILHTPDDRRTLHIAGKNNTEWNWGQEFRFEPSGNFVTSSISARSNINVNGNNVVLSDYEQWTGATQHVAISSTSHWVQDANTQRWDPLFRVGPLANAPRTGFIYTHVEGDGDASAVWVDYNVPTGIKQGYLVHLPWGNCRYFDIFGRVNGTERYVFIKRVNSWQGAQNENISERHSGITAVGIAGVNRFDRIRVNGRRGRIHLMGIGWTREEGRDMETGFVSWDNVYSRPERIMIADSNIGGSVMATGKISTTNGIVVGPANWTVNPGDITIQNNYYASGGAQLRGGLRVGTGDGIPAAGEIRASGQICVGKECMTETIVRNTILNNQTDDVVVMNDNKELGSDYKTSAISNLVVENTINAKSRLMGGSGNITGGLRVGKGDIPAAGAITATGTITGASFSTAGAVSGDIISTREISLNNPNNIGGTHFNWQNKGENYIRGKTQIDGLTTVNNNITSTGTITGGALSTAGDLNAARGQINNGLNVGTTANPAAGTITATGKITGGAITATGTITGGAFTTGGLLSTSQINVNNPSGTNQTHFNYLNKGENYIRGNTQIDGLTTVNNNINSTGTITASGKVSGLQLCADDACLTKDLIDNIRANNRAGDVVIKDGNNNVTGISDLSVTRNLSAINDVYGKRFCIKEGNNQTCIDRNNVALKGDIPNWNSLSGRPTDLATQSWVNNESKPKWDNIQGRPTNLATQTWVGEQGFLKSIPTSYATQTWVNNESKPKWENIEGRPTIPSLTNGLMAVNSNMTGNITTGGNVKGNQLCIGNTCLTESDILQLKNNPSPVGTIVALYDRDVPANWLLCDGQWINRTNYPALFDVLVRVNAPARNNNSERQVPDLNNMFLRGTTNKSWQNLASFFPVGTTGGKETVTLSTNNLPSHSHSVGTLTTTSAGSHHHSGTTNSSGGHSHTAQYPHLYGGNDHNRLTEEAHGGHDISRIDEWRGTSWNGDHEHTFTTSSEGSHTHTISGNTGSTGGGTAFSIIPPSYYILYIIKAR